MLSYPFCWIDSHELNHDKLTLQATCNMQRTKIGERQAGEGIAVFFLIDMRHFSSHMHNVHHSFKFTFASATFLYLHISEDKKKDEQYMECF